MSTHMRALFEQQLNILVDKVKNGQDYSADFDKILYCYNCANENLLTQLRELLK